MQQFLKFLVLLSVVFFAFYSCEKVREDKIPPILILEGDNPMNLFPGCSFDEPGFILSDDLTPTADIILISDTSVVNADSIGVYYIDYVATDTDGNSAFAQRKVIVKELNLNYYDGQLFAYDTLKPLNSIDTLYRVNCTLFNETFSWIKISNFNNFGDNFEVIMIPDAAGNLQLTYDLSGTLINGSGSTFCDMSGFRLEYWVKTSNNEESLHHVTYKFKEL